MITYDLTSEKIKGKAQAVYKEGNLQSFAFLFDSPLNAVQYQAFTKTLWEGGYKEVNVANFEKIGMKVEQVKEAGQMELEEEPVVETKGTEVSNGISLFCAAYKKAFGVPYHVQGFEGAKLKQNKSVKITTELLDAYFTTDAWQIEGNYSIMNYIKHYNTVVREAAGFKVKPDFVNYYDKRIEDGMDNSKKQLYWAHLRAQGLKPKKLRGKTVGWEKQATQTV